MSKVLYRYLAVSKSKERIDVMKEITLNQLKEKNQGECLLVDIRDEGSVLYGIIPGAINIPASLFEEDLEEAVRELDTEKEIIIYCQRGEKSREIVETLESHGIDSFSLVGGYNAFLVDAMEETENGEAEEVVVADYIAAMTDRYAIAKYEDIYIPKVWHG